MMPCPRRKPGSAGSSSPKPATDVSAPVSSSSSMISAVGGDDQVPRLLQRELRHALDVEQRRQLLGEAVDQVDLAIEVQHFGAERLALACRVATRCSSSVATAPRLAPARTPSRGCVLVRDREARRDGGLLARLAVQQAAVGVLDGHRRRRARPTIGDTQRARLRLAPDQLPERGSGHDVPTDRARRAPSAAARPGSNGLVMYRSAPTSWPRCRSNSWPLAVSSTM